MFAEAFVVPFYMETRMGLNGIKSHLVLKYKEEIGWVQSPPFH